MDDLIAFIKARLDEEEAMADAAPGSRWQAFGEDDVAGASVYDEQWRLLTPARYDHDNPLSARPGATGPQYIQRARDELCAHIARHDPARVLREAEAKRAHIAMYLAQPGYDLPEGVNDGRDDSERLRDEGIKIVLEAVLDHDAAVYSDHPGYRQEWAP